jgi:hypothetical protein
VSIKQLNASYVPEEDRVQFRFTTGNDEEFRLWLTRSGVAQVLAYGRIAVVKTLAQIHAPAQAEMIAEFKQQAIAQSVNFKESFQSGKSFPLQEEFLLIQKIQIVKEGDLHHLAMVLANKQTLNLRVTEDLLTKMCALLQKIEQAARWGLDEPEWVALGQKAADGVPATIPLNLLH